MRHIGNVQVSGSFKQQGSDDNVFSGDLRVADTRIMSNGYTKFGNDAFDEHEFSGSIYVLGDGNATGIFFDEQVRSSIRFKDNVSNLSQLIVDKLDLVRPTEFDLLSNGEHSYGFIAEEIDEIYPDIVIRRNDEIIGLKYNMFIPILVKEIQNLRQRVAQLESGSL